MADPGKEHWNAVKWIFRYLTGTRDFGILFDTRASTEVVGYLEYMAMTEAGKEAVWLSRLVNELGFKQDSMVLHCDSQSAIHLAKNQVYHARTKHIAVRYHKIGE